MDKRKLPAEVWKQREDGMLADTLAGMSQAKALKNNGISPQTLHDMLCKNPEFAKRYRLARLADVEAKVTAMEDIATTEPDVQRARLICENRKWLASKLIPHVYGDKLDVTVTNKVDASDAMAAAKTRVLRRMRDQATDAEWQPVENKQESEPKPTDKQSAARESRVFEDDIFG